LALVISAGIVIVAGHRLDPGHAQRILAEVAGGTRIAVIAGPVCLGVEASFRFVTGVNSAGISILAIHQLVTWDANSFNARIVESANVAIITIDGHRSIGAPFGRRAVILRTWIAIVAAYRRADTHSRQAGILLSTGIVVVTVALLRQVDASIHRVALGCGTRIPVVAIQRSCSPMTDAIQAVVSGRTRVVVLADVGVVCWPVLGGHRRHALQARAEGIRRAVVIACSVDEARTRDWSECAATLTIARICSAFLLIVTSIACALALLINAGILVRARILIVAWVRIDARFAWPANTLLTELTGRAGAATSAATIIAAVPVHAVRLASAVSGALFSVCFIGHFARSLTAAAQHDQRNQQQNEFPHFFVLAHCSLLA
jgi:hypothetical protein